MAEQHISPKDSLTLASTDRKIWLSIIPWRNVRSVIICRKVWIIICVCVDVRVRHVSVQLQVCVSVSSCVCCQIIACIYVSVAWGCIHMCVAYECAHMCMLVTGEHMSTCICGQCEQACVSVACVIYQVDTSSSHQGKVQIPCHPLHP